MKGAFTIIGLLSVILLLGCEKEQSLPLVDAENFQIEHEGQSIDLYTLENTQGMVVQITNYGGRVVALFAPDRTGQMADIVAGYDHIQDYIDNPGYFGALIGRYGNRIANGKFTLNDTEYTLATNNGENHLHGGNKGFDSVVWQAHKTRIQGADALELNYVSPEGQEGYPGTLNVKVTYSLTDSNELKIDYFASTDKPTIVNLTHHSFFNLAGHNHESILDHELMINGEFFLPVDEGLIPTGEIRPVSGTPMDFTIAHRIGDRIDQAYPQLERGRGYDHCWVIDKKREMSLAAHLYEPQSGRTLQVYTNQPGMQFYSGNFLDGSKVGKNGVAYPYRSSLCLETQYFPDSPNKPQFPSVILNPGEPYIHHCVYKFSAN